jgi:hypothetical protein
MYIVAAFEKKSDPTMDIAVEIDPEKRRDVKNVIHAAIKRHIMAFTKLRAFVSEKFAAALSANCAPSR